MALAETARLIAALELQDKFSGPARNVDRSIGGLERSVGRLDRVGSTAARGIGTLTGNIVKIGSIATGALIGGLGAAVVAASDLNEEIDKSAVVFGPAADEVQRFADGAAAIGLSKAEALGAAGAFGNMFNTVGLTQRESAEFSQTMVQLAADMASFNNEDPSEMLDRLRSGLSGEAEPLRRFGVLLSEATVKEFAYREGIAETGAKLTEAQKVQARYGLILEQTAIQQGNFADTSGSLANQQRQLRANLSNTAATIGTALLPSVGKLAAAINEVFIDKQPQIAAFGERIGEALAKILTDENIDRAIDGIGDFIDKLATGDVSGTLQGFSGIVSGIGSLPWAAIGDAAQLLGTGSKALLDAFLGMPPWVQTAVLTGWGLNKLTGGALTTIFGTLASGLIKGILNMNAGVVNINAGTVNGAGAGTAGAGAGGLASVLQGFLLTAGIAGVTAGGIERTVGGGLEEAVTKGDLVEIIGNIDFSPGALIAEALDEPFDALIATITGTSSDELTQEEKTTRATERAAAAVRDATPWAIRNRDAVNNLNASEGRRFSNLQSVTDRRLTAVQAETTRAKSAIHTLNANEGSRAAVAHARLAAIRDIESGASGKLTGILRKKTSVNVTANITTTTYVSPTLVSSRTAQAVLYNESSLGGGI